MLIFFKKINFITTIIEIENKIFDTTDYIKKLNFNAKTGEIENKAPNTKNLVTKSNLDSKLQNTLKDLID